MNQKMQAKQGQKAKETSAVPAEAIGAGQEGTLGLRGGIEKSPALTNAIGAYYKKNLAEDGNLDDAEGLLAAAKAGGEALQGYLEKQLEEHYEGLDSDEVSDPMFLHRALWREASPLIDWDAVAGEIRDLQAPEY